jgi:hypothetical protein
MKNLARTIIEEMSTGGIANSMGGTFNDPEVGDSGNLAGMSLPLGHTARRCLTHNAAGDWKRRLKKNKKDEDEVSKLVAILLRNNKI